MRKTLALCLGLVFLFLSQTASAKSHLWKFTEVFSNEDGSVQFIEMFVFDPAGTREIQLEGFPLESSANTFIFPNDLPNVNTFHTWILIATPAFAALPGAPTPDYVIPPNFFDPAGDQLRYRTVRDILTLPAGAVPVDGIHSFMRDGSIEVNSPTNFAGVMGSIDVSLPCDDGLDNDGDGAIDFPDDPGCASADDPDHSERELGGGSPCDNGDDDDDDGLVDHPEDPGCYDPTWSTEAPQCQDGANNNDGDALVDFDGGQSIHGACSGGACPPGVSDPDQDGVANPDPQCIDRPFRKIERKDCGLGAELALALAVLARLRVSRRRSAAAH
jgi:hypothetical protein